MAKPKNQTNHLQKAKKTGVKTLPVTTRKRRSIDGIASPATAKQAATVMPVSNAAAMPPITNPAKRPTMHDVVRPTKQTSRQLEHSKTLMRSAVHKPIPAPRHHVTTPLPSHLAAVTVAPKLSVAAVNNRRLRHASAINKSKLVTRFSDTTGTFQPTAPRQFSPVAKPIMAPTPVSKSNDMFMSALNAATSHQQSPVKLHAHKQSRRRGSTIMAVSVATLGVALLLGFVVSQNMGSIRLQLASSKAGFTASVPTHKPSGFSLGNFSASAGVVTAHFHSNSDNDRKFTITEKPSGWDSTALRDSYVKQVTLNYQVVESAGRTIYLYDGDSATWVSGGVWYLVTGASSLSNSQLIQLATSM